MEKIINIANQIIFYSVYYTLLIVVYGLVFYNVFKFIIKIAVYTFRHLRADWMRWRNGK